MMLRNIFRAFPKFNAWRAAMTVGETNIAKLTPPFTARAMSKNANPLRLAPTKAVTERKTYTNMWKVGGGLVGLGIVAAATATKLEGQQTRSAEEEAALANLRKQIKQIKNRDDQAKVTIMIWDSNMLHDDYGHASIVVRDCYFSIHASFLENDGYKIAKTYDEDKKYMGRPSNRTIDLYGLEAEKIHDKLLCLLESEFTLKYVFGAYKALYEGNAPKSYEEYRNYRNKKEQKPTDNDNSSLEDDLIEEAAKVANKLNIPVDKKSISTVWKVAIKAAETAGKAFSGPGERHIGRNFPLKISESHYYQLIFFTLIDHGISAELFLTNRNTLKQGIRPIKHLGMRENLDSNNRYHPYGSTAGDLAVIFLVYALSAPVGIANWIGTLYLSDKTQGRIMRDMFHMQVKHLERWTNLAQKAEQEIKNGEYREIPGLDVEESITEKTKRWLGY